MKKGFTLIEVMISLFILLVGMTGVIQMYGTGAYITKSSEDLTYAQNLSRTVLQTQLSRNPNLIATTPTCIYPTGLSNSVTFKNTVYSVTCNIALNQIGGRVVGASETITNRIDTSIAFVSVRVTWRDNLNNGTLSNHTVMSSGLWTFK